MLLGWRPSHLRCLAAVVSEADDVSKLRHVCPVEATLSGATSAVSSATLSGTQTRICGPLAPFTQIEDGDRRRERYRNRVVSEIDVERSSKNMKVLDL